MFKVKSCGARSYGVVVTGFVRRPEYGDRPTPLGFVHVVVGGDRDAARKEAQALCDLLNQAKDAFEHGVRAADLVQRPAESTYSEAMEDSMHPDGF